VGPKNHVLDGGPDPPLQGTILNGEGRIIVNYTALYGELCRNGWTDRFGLEWLKEPCIRWGAHWRYLANAIEPSMCGGDATFLSNYFEHHSLLWSYASVEKIFKHYYTQWVGYRELFLAAGGACYRVAIGQLASGWHAFISASGGDSVVRIFAVQCMYKRQTWHQLPATSNTYIHALTL